MSISQGDGRDVATSLGRAAVPLKLEEARNVFSALSLWRGHGPANTLVRTQ